MNPPSFIRVCQQNLAGCNCLSELIAIDNTDVFLLQDPSYRRFQSRFIVKVPPGFDATYDPFVIPRALILMKQGIGESVFSFGDIVCIKIRDIYYVSAYLDPSLRPFECISFLQSAMDRLPLGCKLVLCGDFNAHHMSWGDKKSDPRGILILKWLEESNLLLANTGKMTYHSRTWKTWSAAALQKCSASWPARQCARDRRSC